MFGSEKTLRAADENDFRLIYDSVMPVLYKVVYNIVREEDAAEDICHDALIKMMEKNMEFPSINDSKYWLIRVVKNASLNYANRRTRERKAYEKALKEDVRKSESGEITVLKEETVNTVQLALEKLPIKLRIVLQLKEYGDLNYKEIGRILGITEGNVKVRVFRAREQLAKYIGETDVYMP
ncbi:RNA polymerase sigma factor [Treponema phagedenis]|uniref:RNA polymerase sigma factor n=1 Tax=Treponema phagedenis TaxID=162 RepID=A0A0B7GUT9_TREPH|nr:RNA polymerase sigma factor [Treponema phagedenis]NVP25110.1 RNA polymerase sigma factor [Treponema phagedenis]QEJ94111.1 RNA polymerase sigma factor [Treponema phagedenis]QEJ97224.1 RNA polymerase sigma factor [Treponema phagedenis]QEK01878.1 RNA polymerase sigma factor [Treponema phagedenis]QEK02583.1 RNA polymerase sigma factor [Treponema phagedenis]